MNLRLFVPAFALCLASLAPQIAHAQFGLSSSSASNATGLVSIPFPPYSMYGSDPHSDKRTGFIGPISSNASSAVGFLYAEGSSSASGTVNYGNIHAASNGGGGGGSGGSNNTSRWFDVITVKSPTLPYGSPVTLTANAHYTGLLSAYISSPLSAGGFGVWEGKASVTFQSRISGTALSYDQILNLTTPQGLYTRQMTPIDQTIQQSITTYVGATLTLDSQTDVSASGHGGGNFKDSGGGYVSVDSVFDVQAQTAGVFLSRASAAVPEPSAPVIVLIGAAVVGAGFGLRRRRQHA